MGQCTSGPQKPGCHAPLLASWPWEPSLLLAQSMFLQPSGLEVVLLSIHPPQAYPQRLTHFGPQQPYIGMFHSKSPLPAQGTPGVDSIGNCMSPGGAHVHPWM